MLTLSTKARYATRILTFLAKDSSGKPVSAKKISESENISFDYTEQILIVLKGAKLVRSTRGSHGGFVLTKPPDQITVADVLTVVDGELSIIPCLNESCPRTGSCPTQPIWRRANEALRKVFSETTLAELASSKDKDCENKAINYVI